MIYRQLVITALFIGSCAIFVRVPKIEPYQGGRFVEQRALYCSFSVGTKEESCFPILLFEDGTVFVTTRLVPISNFKSIMDRKNIYDEFGESGWGKYSIYGDTLRMTYAEAFNRGGALVYPKFEDAALYSDTTLTLLPNPRLGHVWIENRLLQRINSVDLSFLDPSKAWINRK
jgi:hypothetical protein